MAIGWAMPRYIQRSRSGNIVRTVAYNTRSMIWDERQGEMWDGTRKLATLLNAEVMLPDGSDERFRNVAHLVNAIDASEKRRDSVLGRDFILPLPRGVDSSTKLELARGFFNEYFVANGVPVILALHKAHLGKDGQKENDHAHGVVPQRYLEGDRFSAKKALVHEPEMLTGKKRFVAKAVNWSRAWREYQERHGIEVDPPTLFPGKHLGPGHARNPTSEISRQHAARQKMIEQFQRETSTLVRLYRVEIPPSDRRSGPDWAQQAQASSGHTAATDRWFTDDPKALDWYRQDAGVATRTAYIDVPAVDLEKYRVSRQPNEVRRFSRDPENEFFLPRELADQRRELPKEEITMQLSDGANTISDDRFRAALAEMRGRHADEYETVHNGSGRSEELPSQLRERHNREHQQLIDDRRNLSVAQWVRHYPDREVARSGERQQEQTPALYDRYKAERGQSVASRKAAEQDVYDKFSSYNSQVRSFYAVQHQQQKLAVARGSERYKEHEVLKAEQGRDRVEAHQLRAQQLAAARAAHPVLTWDAFLSREAGRGDHEAARLLQQRQQREVQHGHER